MIKPIETVIAHPSEHRQACVEHVVRQLPRALRPAVFGRRRYPTIGDVLPPIAKPGAARRAW